MKRILQMEPLIEKEERAAVSAYMKSGAWLMEFDKTREFEKRIAEVTGAKYCSVVSNGTVSLFLMLKALGVGPGDEVIVPDITMAATPNSVILAGAEPIFVDIEQKSLCLDVNKVEMAITPRTKAVLHVSLNGRAGDLARLQELCIRHNIPLIEDSAQSLGSFYQGKHLGTIGVMGSFSFSVPKIITTGQGGAIITNDEKLFEKLKKLKDFGRSQGGVDFYETVGWNFKFTDLQAVIGIQQIKKLKKRIARKRSMYALYKKLLSNIPEVGFIDIDLKESVPWSVDVLVSRRQDLIDYLLAQGIITRKIYPALHSQPAYGKKGSYPIAESVTESCLWLPSSLSLTDTQITYVCSKISKYYHP